MGIICWHEIDWQKFWWEVRTTVWFVSFVSAAVSFALVVLYTCRPTWRKTPGWLMQRAVGFDFLAAVALLIFVNGGPGPGAADADAKGEGYVAKRKLVILSIMAAEMGANTWRLVMFLHIAVIYRNPFSPDRCSMVYPLVVLMLTGVGTSLCAAKIWSNGKLKGAAPLDADFEFAIVFPVLVYPMFFVALGSLVQLAIWSAIRSDRSGQRHASVSYAARERMTSHGLWYLSLHALQLFLGVMVLGLLIATGWRRQWLWHVVMVLLCGRPLLTHLGWLVLGRRFGRLFSVLRWDEGTTASPSVTRKPTSAEETHPAEAAASAQQTLPVSVELAELRSASASSAATPSSSSSRAAPSPPRRTILEDIGPSIGGHELMSELRFEVLYDAARSIGDDAQRQLQVSALQHRNHAPVRVGRASCFSFGGYSNLGAGAPSESGKDAGQVLSSAGLLHRPRQTLAADRRLTVEPVATSAASGAKHYQAEAFAAIRQAFGICPEQYARDFPSDLSRLTSRWMQRLRESVSEGASGSFFYRVLSQSSKGVASHFIVKEISGAEKSTLMALLPAYRKHIEDRGGRSFIQYFGCHSVPLRWKYAARVHFVVMRNILPVPMWLVFDLKGATINRRALKGKTLLEVKTGGGGSQQQASYGTLRDWEWMDIAMAVDVAPEDKVEIAETLRADSDFLGRQNLLDYSLLVGIHRLPHDSTSTPASREERISQLVSVGGYVSLDRQKVYFCGIIDVLETYSLGWRAQHAVFTMGLHSVLHGASADGISAMAPDFYADRFYTFILKEVLQLNSCGGPADEAEHLEEGGGIFAGTCLDRGPSMGIGRWGKLWTARRRGLVRERMEAERVDFLRRIEELEQELGERRGEAPSPSSPCAREDRGKSHRSTAAAVFSA